MEGKRFRIYLTTVKGVWLIVKGKTKPKTAECQNGTQKKGKKEKEKGKIVSISDVTIVKSF